MSLKLYDADSIRSFELATNLDAAFAMATSDLNYKMPAYILQGYIEQGLGKLDTSLRQYVQQQISNYALITNVRGIDIVDNQNGTLTFTNYDNIQKVVNTGKQPISSDNSVIITSNTGSNDFSIAPTLQRIDASEASLAYLYGTVLSKTVMTNVSMYSDASTVVVTKQFVNLAQGSGQMQEFAMPVASETQAGVLNSATYISFLQALQTIEELQNLGYVFAHLGSSPTQQTLNDTWQTAKNKAPADGSSIINLDENNAHYVYGTLADGTQSWVNQGDYVLPVATTSIMGGVKGSLVDGQIYVEADGTQSLNGYDAIITAIDNANNSMTTKAQVGTVNEVAGSYIASITLSNNAPPSVVTKPLPVVNNGQLSIYKNNVLVQTFSANQTGNVSCNITVTKGDVGLNNVDNTSDLSKPLSTAVINALANKFDKPTGDATQWLQGNGVPVTKPVIPTTLPPSGNAGGDLAGTYPSPTVGNDKITIDKQASFTVTLPTETTEKITQTELNGRKTDGFISLLVAKINGVISKNTSQDVTIDTKISTSTYDLSTINANGSVTLGAIPEETNKLGVSTTFVLAHWIRSISAKINGLITTVGTKIATSIWADKLERLEINSSGILTTTTPAETTAKIVASSDSLAIWFARIFQRLNGIITALGTKLTKGTTKNFKLEDDTTYSNIKALAALFGLPNFTEGTASNDSQIFRGTANDCFLRMPNSISWSLLADAPNGTNMLCGVINMNYRFGQGADGNNYGQQVIVSRDNAGLWSRSKENGTWSAWIKYANTTELANKVNKTGDTMTGNLIVPSIRATNGTLEVGTNNDNGNLHLYGNLSVTDSYQTSRTVIENDNASWYGRIGGTFTGASAGILQTDVAGNVSRLVTGAAEQIRTASNGISSGYVQFLSSTELAAGLFVNISRIDNNKGYMLQLSPDRLNGVLLGFSDCRGCYMTRTINRTSNAASWTVVSDWYDVIQGSTTLGGDLTGNIRTPFLNVMQTITAAQINNPAFFNQNTTQIFNVQGVTIGYGLPDNVWGTLINYRNNVWSTFFAQLLIVAYPNAGGSNVGKMYFRSLTVQNTTTALPNFTPLVMEKDINYTLIDRVFPYVSSGSVGNGNTYLARMSGSGGSGLGQLTKAAMIADLGINNWVNVGISSNQGTVTSTSYARYNSTLKLLHVFIEIGNRGAFNGTFAITFSGGVTFPVNSALYMMNNHLIEHDEPIKLYANATASSTIGAYQASTVTLASTGTIYIEGMLPTL